MLMLLYVGVFVSLSTNTEEIPGKRCELVMQKTKFDQEFSFHDVPTLLLML